uniref:Protein phosphatase n=1 Tax=Cajanus cajan TaxID=3821 RepID=A0A151TZ19_CAJCA|nr:putative protein phosphatase 2C 55 [Cajanus cajan]
MPSNYFSRLGASIKRSVVGKEAAEVLIAQGKFSRFFHSLHSSYCVELGGKRRTLSVVDTLSRTFSVPSIQVCGYHIGGTLVGPDQLSTAAKFRVRTMAAHLPRLVVGESHLDNPVFKNGGKVIMSLRNHQQPDGGVICGYFIYNAAKTWCNSQPCMQSGSGDFHSLSTSCYSAGPAHDVPFDTCAREEQLRSSADSSELKTPSRKTLKLISGSCYLPHPDKEETGGEDAHFICSEEQAVGVADGEEPKGSIDPARVLEKAHSSTKAKGSSTACIIALTEQGLNAINLGDSGFMVVRDGCTVFRSPVQQHDFNFTYQLECGSNGDLPSSGQVFTIPVAPGDVIVAGTDGLFDNLYNNEITAVVVHAMRAGLSPQVTAQKIAALARQRALDKDRQTPFSTAAQDAGFRYYGGKLDDTTVVVSYITGSGDA